MKAVANLSKGRARVWMLYQAYQGSSTGIDVVPSLPKVGYVYGRFVKLTKRSGMVRLIVPVSVPDPEYFNKDGPGIRISSRERTLLTKVTGTGGEVVPILPKCRVRVWMPYRTYQRVTCGYGCWTKLTKGWGTGIDVVPSSSKSRVRLWMFYQAYHRVGYGTVACTRIRTRHRVFQQGRTRHQGVFPLAYRTYQSIGYGW